MSPAQNEILARSFREVWATRGLGKCRALVARDPLPTARTAAPTFPLTSILREPELTAAIGRDQLVLVSHGGVFAGGKLDIGTRALLTTAEQWPAAEGIVDLGCGTGILATVAALRNPDATVIATDRSSAAVRSAAATAAANGLSVPAIVHADVVFPGNWAENDTNVHARRDRVGSDVCARRDQVGARGVVAIQADAGAGIPDQSQDLVLLNPPFHDRTAISTDAAHAMFAAAARMLKPGGELWVVWNSHLRYRPALERTVGPTDQILRTSKFTVTRSRRAPAAR